MEIREHHEYTRVANHERIKKPRKPTRLADGLGIEVSPPVIKLDKPQSWFPRFMFSHELGYDLDTIFPQLIVL